MNSFCYVKGVFANYAVTSALIGVGMLAYFYRGKLSLEFVHYVVTTHLMLKFEQLLAKQAKANKLLLTPQSLEIRRYETMSANQKSSTSAPIFPPRTSTDSPISIIVYPLKPVKAICTRFPHRR